MRAIIPARSRRVGQWFFENVFVGVFDRNSIKNQSSREGGRNVYLADLKSGLIDSKDYAYSLINSDDKRRIDWVNGDSQVVARLATNILNKFDWANLETCYLRKIPCVNSAPQTESDSRELGCGLAISSIFLVYRPSPSDEFHIILLQRKGDIYPGYGGGKIETLNDAESKNLDPISCCIEEGREEYGFDILPLGLMGVACTPLHMPSEKYYNSLINYSFIARPKNLKQVEEALKNPGNFLEDKMESYVIESMNKFNNRVLNGKLRTPDMIELGDLFFKGEPADRIPLTQFYDSGIQ